MFRETDGDALVKNDNNKKKADILVLVRVSPRWLQLTLYTKNGHL